MTDIINDRYLHPQNEIIFFLFRNYYSIISASWPMNDRYLHPQNDIILFYFETITASYQHLDQWLIWWMINISIIKMKLFFFISKLLQHHFSNLTNDWCDEWYINMSILKMKYFFFISKLLEHHSTTLTNDWYNKW